MLYHLSKVATGDLVTTRWPLDADRRRPREPVSFDTLGNFGYHATVSTQLPGFVRSFWNFAYSLGKSLQLSILQGRYDLVIAYGPFSLAVVGWFLKLFTRTKLVIEVPGPPTDGFIFEGGLVGRVKHRVALILVPFILRRADALRLYYAWQLDGLPGGQFPQAHVFPDFVPLALIDDTPRNPPGSSRNTILFLGYPFNRKGVDVLIKAFLRIAERHPQAFLSIVGHCPNLAPYEELAEGHPRIEFHRGVNHDEAMRRMAECTIFALPSRMEGVPRVLIEAMAARKPVVSTRVSGIPALVDHETNGLLCDVDDDAALAQCLDRLLSDHVYADKLAEEGHRHVRNTLSEACFVEQMSVMFESLVRTTNIPVASR